MSIYQTQNRVRSTTMIRGTFDYASIAELAAGVIKRHGTFKNYGMTDDEVRTGVLNSIDSAVAKLYQRELYGEDTNMMLLDDILALAILAMINEANDELNAIWSLDNTEDVETCKKRERNVRSRLRRAEHKFFGRSLNLINHI